MKPTNTYLDEVKTKLGLQSDYALAKWLDTTRSTVSNWRSGRNILDDYAAARIAEALGLNPMDVIAAANYEREKDGKRRAYWGKYFTAAGITAVVCGMLWNNNISSAYANTSSDLDGAANSYYVK